MEYYLPCRSSICVRSLRELLPANTGLAIGVNKICDGGGVNCRNINLLVRLAVYVFVFAGFSCCRVYAQSEVTFSESPLISETPTGGAVDASTLQLLSLPDLTSGEARSLNDFNTRSQLESLTADRRDDSEQRTLSIADVRLISIANNLDIKAEFVNPLIAAESIDEELARFDAVISASVSVNSDEPPPDPGAPEIRLTGYSAAAQIEFPLRTGGNATISLPTMLIDPDLPGAGNIQDTSVNLTVAQPLMRNAGRAIAETSIRVAELQSAQQIAQTKLAVIQTLAAAENAYWSYYITEATLDVRYQQYERALEVEKKVKRLAQVEVASEVETTRARSGVSRTLQGIIIAETERRTSQRSLKVVLNDHSLPIAGSTNLSVDSFPDPIFLPLDGERIVELAIKNRLDLIDLQLQLSVEDLALLFNANQLKPALDLNASASIADRGSSLSDSLGADFTSWNIGATFSLPIGNRAAKSRLRQSELQKERVAITMQNQRRVVTRQVYDAIDQLEQSWQLILAARQESALASSTFDAEERQFLAGVRTATDVLEAADFLAEAQLREVQALGAYEQSKITLALATGTLLGKGKIQFR